MILKNNGPIQESCTGYALKQFLKTMWPQAHFVYDLPMIPRTPG